MKIVAACTALSLDDEQRGYFGIDGVFGHLGVHMRMGNKGSLFLCFS